MSRIHRPHTASSILVIEPDALMLAAIGGVLDMQGHKAILARSEQVAQQAFQSGHIDLVILSIENLDEGCALAGRLRSTPDHAEVPIIFIVPELASHWSASLQEQGGVFCMLRSHDPHALIDLVDKALWMPHIARRRAAPPAPHTNTTNDWVKLD